jgi:hypothetical protein
MTDDSFGILSENKRRAKRVPAEVSCWRLPLQISRCGSHHFIATIHDHVTYGGTTVRLVGQDGGITPAGRATELLSSTPPTDVTWSEYHLPIEGRLHNGPRVFFCPSGGLETGAAGRGEIDGRPSGSCNRRTPNAGTRALSGTSSPASGSQRATF